MRGLITRQAPTAQIQDSAIVQAKIAAAAQALLSGKKIQPIPFCGGYDSTPQLVTDDYLNTWTEVAFTPAERENITRVSLCGSGSFWGGSTGGHVWVYDVTNANDLNDANSIAICSAAGFFECAGDLRDDASWPGGAADFRLKFITLTGGTFAVQQLFLRVYTDD